MKEINDILTTIYETLKTNDYDKIKSLVQRLFKQSDEFSQVNTEPVYHYCEEHDYFKAPGSTHYHDSEPMGLVKHSLRVTFWAIKYFDAFFSDSDKTLQNLGFVIIAALCHDLCKVDRFTTEQKWKKDERNQWVAYDAYTVRDDYKSLGHGSESMRRLFYLCPNLPFKVQAAVYWHMGLFDTTDTQGFSKAYKEEPLVLCIVTADMLSTQRAIKPSDVTG